MQRGCTPNSAWLRPYLDARVGKKQQVVIYFLDFWLGESSTRFQIRDYDHKWRLVACSMEAAGCYSAAAVSHARKSGNKLHARPDPRASCQDDSFMLVQAVRFFSPHLSPDLELVQRAP